MNAVTLRPASPQDQDFILAVCRATMMEYHQRARGWDEAACESAFVRHLNLPITQIVLLAGEPAGILTIMRAPHATGVLRIALLPSFQGQGIGTFLMQLVQEASAREGRPVRLSVYKCNPAWNLYRRLGFQVVSETDVEYRMMWQPPRHGSTEAQGSSLED